MPKFRPKYTIVEAWRNLLDNIAPAWVIKDCAFLYDGRIRATEGDCAIVGDWLIKTDEGIKICNDVIFQSTYEEISSESDTNTDN